MPLDLAKTGGPRFGTLKGEAKQTKIVSAAASEINCTTEVSKARDCFRGASRIKYEQADDMGGSFSGSTCGRGIALSSAQPQGGFARVNNRSGADTGACSSNSGRKPRGATGKGQGSGSNASFQRFAQRGQEGYSSAGCELADPGGRELAVFRECVKVIKRRQSAIESSGKA